MDELCKLVAAVCAARVQIDTVKQLSDALRIHVRSIERRCQAVGTTARDLVAFVACAQVVLDASVDQWEPANHFPDRDPRTGKKLTLLGGLDTPEPPTIGDFVRTQKFISNNELQKRLIHHLEER